MLTQETKLPLFPLNTVLFPGMTLPLRIFEPRYRQMLNDCLGGEQIFGVLLVKEGQEVNSPAVPHRVGTTARLLSVEKKTPDLIHITTIGEERFRLRRILYEKPYLVGQVESFPLADMDTPEAKALAERGTALLTVYLELLSTAIGAEIQLERPPSDPHKVAYLIAMLLQVTLPVKQKLLSVADLPSLLREEAVLLNSEAKALKVMIQAMESRPGDTEGPFSKN